MGELGFGQILLMAGLIVVLLVRAVIQRARRQPEEHIPEEDTVTRIRRQVRATPAPLPASRSPRRRVPESQAPDVRIPLDGSHSIRKSLLENPRDLRRGIIVMTILGPCRAFDPSDQP